MGPFLRKRPKKSETFFNLWAFNEGTPLSFKALTIDTLPQDKGLKPPGPSPLDFQLVLIYVQPYLLKPFPILSPIEIESTKFLLRVLSKFLSEMSTRFKHSPIIWLNEFSIFSNDWKILTKPGRCLMNKFFSIFHLQFEVLNL